MTAQTTASTEPAYYRPELDALRFLAFVGTFLFHRMDVVPTDPARDVWTWRIGTIGAFGVPVFFLLSAFLITELLLRERDARGKVDVHAFYIRRVLRIWPLYFAAFYGLALLNHFVPGTGAADPLAWAAFTLFAGNWYVTLKGWIAGPVDPLWSISVEEQFYLVIPWVVARGGRRALAWVSGAVVILSFVTVAAYAAQRGAEDQGEWTNSFVHFQFFGAGALIALALHGRTPRLPGWLRLAGAALAITCWLIAVMVFEVRSWNPRAAIPGALAGWALVLGGTILLFLSTLGIAARRVPDWLAYMGRISYGLYVFHSLMFFLVFHYALAWVGLGAPSAWRDHLGTFAVLALTILAAHASFRWFETPFLRLKRRFAHVPARDERLA